MNVTIEEMSAVVEAYIYEKTRRKVKIIFNNPMSMRMHFKKLCDAYSVVLAYNETQLK